MVDEKQEILEKRIMFLFNDLQYIRRQVMGDDIAKTEEARPHTDIIERCINSIYDCDVEVSRIRGVIEKIGSYKDE